jgi:flagellar protein FlbD
MIQLTRLNGHPLVLNSDLIKLVENAPDTVIALVNGEKIVVKETSETILERIVEFRRRVLEGLQMNLSGWTAKKEEGAESIKLKAPPPEEA